VYAVEKFIDLAAKIVGNNNVVTDPKELEKYSRDHSFVKPAMPSCIVRPGDVEEVQEILRIANDLVVPITPLSGGTNNLGGTIPAPGGVILDLRRMNKIISVDPRANMAFIEPGVTFKQLQDYVSKYGLRVLTPAELPAESSVVSTYLDLAPLYGWVYYAEENLTTMSVVIPGGTLLHTGQMAIPQIKEPYMSSHATPFAGLMNYIWYQSQGTLGVVVKGWVKLKPRGEVEKAYFVPVERAEQLHPVVRALAWLRYARDMVILNRMDAALLLADESGNFEENVKNIRAQLPEWIIAFVLRQRADAIEVMEQDISDTLAKFELKAVQDLPGVPRAEEKFRKEVLYPSGWFKYSKYRGARTVLPFIASLKDLPMMMKVLHELCDKYNYPKEDLGVTAVPTISIGVVAVNVAFARDPQNPDEYAKVKKLYYEAAEKLLACGAFYSRPYGILAKLIYTRAQTYYEVMMKVKRVIDPKGIMNPRRFSIFEE